MFLFTLGIRRDSRGLVVVVVLVVAVSADAGVVLVMFAKHQFNPFCKQKSIVGFDLRRRMHSPVHSPFRCPSI